MKKNKWLYYGAAIILGIIIANYLVQQATRLAYLKKVQEEALAKALRKKKADLQANIRTYWIDLETIDDYWFLELDSAGIATAEQAIIQLKKLQKELKTVKNTANDSLRIVYAKKQRSVDLALIEYRKYFQYQLPNWSEKLKEIERLDYKVYSMTENWPSWFESYNNLKLAYFSIIKGHLAQKWNMLYVGGGDLNVNDALKLNVESFYIGRFELTQKRWETIMGENPTKFGVIETNPVVSINAYDAVEFCNKLSEKYGLEPAYNVIFGNTASARISRKPNANGFRLPTNEEWLYAAKGGQKSQGYRFAGSDILDEVAWYANNARSTNRVGGKKYNELHLYDMNGNVYEWTTDPLASQFYNSGGSWYVGGYNCKLEVPQQYDASQRLPYYGMRLLLPAKALNIKSQ